jgi:hypothetical protein
MNLNTIKTTRTAEDEKFAAMSAEARATNAAWDAGRIGGFPTRRPYAIIEINAIGSVCARVAVYNSFSVRDALKGRGYNFDGATKAWYIRRDSVEDAKIEAEKAAEIGIQLGAAMTREDHAAMCR